EAEHQVRLQRQDPVDLRAGEGRHSGLLAPRPRRSHREAGDAHDAPLLAEQVESFGGLLGETHDARGIRVGHARQSNRDSGVAATYSCRTMYVAFWNWLDRILFGEFSEGSTPGGLALRLLRYPYAILRDLSRGQINLYAMGLVYATLLSLIPLLAFAFA